MGGSEATDKRCGSSVDWKASRTATARTSRAGRLGRAQVSGAMSAVRSSDDTLQPRLLNDASVVRLIDRKACRPPKCYLDTERDLVEWLLEIGGRLPRQAPAGQRSFADSHSRAAPILLSRCPSWMRSNRTSMEWHEASYQTPRSTDAARSRITRVRPLQTGCRRPCDGALDVECRAPRPRDRRWPSARIRWNSPTSAAVSMTNTGVPSTKAGTARL